MQYLVHVYHCNNQHNYTFFVMCTWSCLFHVTIPCLIWAWIMINCKQEIYDVQVEYFFLLIFKKIKLTGFVNQKIKLVSLEQTLYKNVPPVLLKLLLLKNLLKFCSMLFPFNYIIKLSEDVEDNSQKMLNKQVSFIFVLFMTFNDNRKYFWFTILKGKKWKIILRVLLIHK